MSIPIGWFSFDGPFDSTEKLSPKAGVYVVLSLEDGGKYTMLEIDEAIDVLEGLAAHERRSCWEEHRNHALHYAVLYTPDLSEESRQLIVKEVRMEYVMPCSPGETPTHGYWDPSEQ